MLKSQILLYFLSLTFSILIKCGLQKELNVKNLAIANIFINGEQLGDLPSVNFDFKYAVKNEIIGPRCIPLKSKNIEANPYHPSLVSRKGAEVRRGLGAPLILNQNPLSCPRNSPNDCVFSLERSFSTTVSDTYSVTLGNSKSFAKTFGSTKTNGITNNIATSIGKSIERSLTKSLSLTSEESFSDQITDQFTQGYDKSSGISLSESKEVSVTSSVTEDLSKSKSRSKESGSTATNSKETSSSDSKGGSKSKSNTNSQEKSSSETQGDSESKTKTQSFEKSKTNTKGGSDSVATSKSKEHSVTDSQGGSVSNSETHTDENTNSDSKGGSKSDTQSHTSEQSKSNTFGGSITDTFSHTDESSNTISNGGSSSDTVSNTREHTNTNTQGGSNSKTKSHTDEVSNTNTKGGSNSINRGQSSEQSSSDSRGKSKSQGFTNSREETSSNTQGGSKSKTNSHTDESNQSTSVGVSASVGFRRKKRSGASVSASVSNTHGSSTSDTNSNTMEDNWSNSRGQSTSNSNSNTNEENESSSRTRGNTNSFSTTGEDNWSNSQTRGSSSTNSETNEKNWSNSVSDSVSNTRGHTDERNWNYAQTQGTSDTRSRSRENNWSAVFGSSVSDTSSVTDEQNWNKMFSKTFSDSDTFSREKNWNQALANSESKSLTNSKEKNWAGTDSNSQSVSLAGSLEKSSSNTNSISNSQSLALSEEENWNAVKGSSDSFSLSKSKQSSLSDTFSYSNGKSDTDSTSRSSSSTKDNRLSDSISYSLSLAKTANIGKTKGDSLSDANSNSYKIDDSFSSSDETTISKNLNDEINQGETLNYEKAKSISYTLTVSTNQQYTIAKGACKILVCLPFVVSSVIPYKCFDENNELRSVHSEILKLDYESLNGNVTCAQTLIDCEEKDKGDLFINNNMELIYKSDDNHFKYGDEFVKAENSTRKRILTSSDSSFNLVLFSNGNLAIMRSQVIVWQNRMNFFSDYKTRVRLNEKGHLIQEAKGIFTNAVKNYRNDEWITVWSSAPINHNYTIGISDHDGQSYQLVLSNKGVLNLYDAVGALIWCTDYDCNHRLGYKFPEVYLVPTNFLTPPENTTHNRISRSVKKTGMEFLMSMDYESKCVVMYSNRAMLSKNKRFKLILEDSGNLIIKDGFRTMWESTSGYIEHAVRPFRLMLGPNCQMFIVSANGYLVWASKSKVKNSENPCALILEDQGRLVINDNLNQTIWQSWPDENDESFGVVFHRPVEYRYRPCHGNKYINRKNLTTQSNKSKSLFYTENIISSNGLWDMVILNNNSLVIRKLNIVKHEIASLDENVTRLVLDENGYFALKNNINEDKWKMNFLKPGSFVAEERPFVLDLTKNGVLRIKNKLNNIIWEYPSTKKTTQLESDGLRSLKNGDSILTDYKRKDELKLVNGDLYLFPRNLTTFSLKFDLFGNDCKITKKTNENDEVKEELVLSNGSLAYYDSNDNIVCQVSFKSANPPFRLFWNDNNNSINIFDSMDKKLMEFFSK